MCNNSKNSLLGYILCGVSISIVTNIMHIIAMYIYYPNWCIYTFGILVAAIICVFLRGNSIKSILCNIGLLLLSNILTEVILLIAGVTNYFYFIAHPTAFEIDIGDSLFQFYLYVYEWAGIIVGFTLVVAKTLVLNREKK